jgi:phosphatidylglycerophosphate synthase
MERRRMLSRTFRAHFAALIRKPLLILASYGITPDALSFAGLLAMLLAGIAIAGLWLRVGALALAMGAILDGVDGEMARLSGQASERGAFVDSICDHLGDFAVYMGLLWYVLAAGQNLGGLLVAAALFGSVFGSLVRARAAVAGIDPKDVGVFTRCERCLVVVIGLLTNEVVPMLVLLAVFNFASAGQRLACARFLFATGAGRTARGWLSGDLAERR